MIGNKVLRRMGVCAAAVASLAGCGGSDDGDTRPDNVAATWFGVTNHHYQIGDVSFIQDGAVSLYVGDSMNATAAVDKTWTALAKGGATTPSHIFVGHDHGDHSVDTAVWARKFPNARIVGPKSQCDSLAQAGVRNECLSLTPEMANGRYVIKLGEHVTIRPVRWLHANHSGCGLGSAAQAATPTYGFLIRTDTKGGVVAVYANDSGTGDNLTVPVVDAASGTYGAPLTNLASAMQDAGVSRLDLWQGGSETRVLKQARYIVPLWHPKAFQPQHWAERNMLQGIPYDWFPGPTFTKYLADNNVAVVKQQNYFDAIVVDATSTRRQSNPAVKAEWGLPADGTGPGPVGTHPRLATIPSGECPTD